MKNSGGATQAVSYYIQLIIIIVIFSSCNNIGSKNNNNDKNSQSYVDSINFKGNWYLNDIISKNILFDTGAYGISISDSIAKRLNFKDSLRISNNNFSYTYTKEYIDIREGSSSKIIIGWKIFENNIIKLSSKEQICWILQDMPRLEGYDCLDYTIVEAIQNKIVISTVLFIQGKKKVVNLVFDTGFNGSFLVSKDALMDLDYSTSSQTSLHTLYDIDLNIRSLDLDSFKIGNLCMEGGELHVTNREKSGKSMNGVIGCSILNDFSIIIDFRNQKIYLKKL